MVASIGYVNIAHHVYCHTGRSCKSCGAPLTIGISSDMLYPSYQQRQIRDLLLSNGTPCEYFEIDSPHGHDAFLINLDQLSVPLGEFVDAIAKS